MALTKGSAIGIMTGLAGLVGSHVTAGRADTDFLYRIPGYYQIAYGCASTTNYGQVSNAHDLCNLILIGCIFGLLYNTLTGNLYEKNNNKE